jgi:2-iminobutanoate/2-iminopropanoate deaminase
MADDRVVANSAPKPLGAYSHAARVDDWLFISGQGARDPKTGQLVSPTSGDYDIRQHTRACIENVKSVVESAGGTIADLVDVTVLLVDMKDFAGMNEVYARYFTVDFPARSTIQVAALPKGANVEIEVIAHF